jgi:hypothetical protein
MGPPATAQPFVPRSQQQQQQIQPATPIIPLTIEAAQMQHHLTILGVERDDALTFLMVLNRFLSLCMKEHHFATADRWSVKDIEQLSRDFKNARGTV